MRRESGGVWLLALAAFLLAPYLGPALAATFPPDPAAAARPSPHGGRAAQPPAGLTFTDSAGCRPAADWRSSRLDPRVRELLQRAARQDRIRVSCLHTGHTKHVRGTWRVSNHWVWRAVDIDRVAGRRVGPGNPAAKRLALAIGRGQLGARPSEVGSPFTFAGRPWFSDAGHQGHLHVGYGR